MIDESWVSEDRIQYKNIDKATLQGVEAEIKYPLSDTLSWAINYTNLDATNDVTNSRLLNRAKHKISSRLSYDDQKDVRANLWCEVYADYLHDTGSNVGINKSYAIWNLNVEKSLNKNNTLSVGIENLLNKKDDDLSLQGAYIYSTLRMKL